ncbi:hypothetical protein Rhe02_91820 [Rhizocola hellebori]|uniref:Uncharacterized protein n=1 Tax=Rhizocola hellebori TaxID=1392758 RepID=A0A8J3QHS7_9ACTN|nr:hypothetical protein [Rhizocola hellebori]GIH11115.1 hypothetical protein Rhe02_91820 [Rhizocola hellebori]
MKNRLDRTQEVPTVPVTSPRQRNDFRPGVAPIPAKREDPTLVEPTMRPGHIVTSGQLKRPKLPMRQRARNLRAGGGWTVGGLVVLLVSWALWAAETGADSVKGSALVLVLILGVAVGLFGLSRLVGSIVLEKLMNRQRRSSVLSHLAIGLFLTLAGASLLRQVEWVITAWNHLIGAR